MAQFQTELFGHVAYSPELSYHDMLDLEERFKFAVQGILEEAAAEFINFEPLGDSLRFQCVFTEGGEARRQAICDKLTEYVKERLNVRLLFADKDLEGVLFCSIAQGRWQECAIALPPPGSLAEKAPPVKLIRPKTDHEKKKAGSARKK